MTVRTSPFRTDHLNGSDDPPDAVIWFSSTIILYFFDGLNLRKTNPKPIITLWIETSTITLERP
jgi:hypothetical protein